MEFPTRFSNEEKTAMLVLLGKYNEAMHRRAIDLDIAKKAQERVKIGATQIERLRAAFEAFGIDVSEDKVWEKLRDLVGPGAYQKVLDRTTPEDTVVEIPAFEDDVAPETAGTITVRDLVLESLEEADEKGQKAGEIQAQIETRRGTKLHPKTTGMTLYRLSQDGLVRREGRTWFFVPQDAEKKNPGGETPGPSNVSN